jgi:hypothetical protein
MSIFEQRLSVVTSRTTSLNAQMRELKQLRDQVKRAESASPRSRPTFRGKRARIWNDKVVAAAEF